MPISEAYTRQTLHRLMPLVDPRLKDFIKPVIDVLKHTYSEPIPMGEEEINLWDRTFGLFDNISGCVNDSITGNLLYVSALKPSDKRLIKLGPTALPYSQLIEVQDYGVLRKDHEIIDIETLLEERKGKASVVVEPPKLDNLQFFIQPEFSSDFDTVYSLNEFRIGIHIFAKDKEGRWIMESVQSHDDYGWPEGHDHYVRFSPVSISSLFTQNDLDGVLPKRITISDDEFRPFIMARMDNPEEIDKLPMPDIDKINLFFSTVDRFVNNPDIPKQQLVVPSAATS